MNTKVRLLIVVAVMATLALAAGTALAAGGVVKTPVEFEDGGVYTTSLPAGYQLRLESVAPAGKGMTLTVKLQSSVAETDAFTVTFGKGEDSAYRLKGQPWTFYVEMKDPYHGKIVWTSDNKALGELKIEIEASGAGKATVVVEPVPAPAPKTTPVAKAGPSVASFPVQIKGTDPNDLGRYVQTGAKVGLDTKGKSASLIIASGAPLNSPDFGYSEKKDAKVGGGLYVLRIPYGGKGFADGVMVEVKETVSTPGQKFYLYLQGLDGQKLDLLIERPAAPAAAATPAAMPSTGNAPAIIVRQPNVFERFLGWFLSLFGK